LRRIARRRIARRAKAHPQIARVSLEAAPPIMMGRIGGVRISRHEAQ
jgi:hypothetical protein